VDGAATSLNVQSYNKNSTAGTAQITLSGRALISGLSAGNHTFAVYGTSYYGAQADNVSIQVQPVLWGRSAICLNHRFLYLWSVLVERTVLRLGVTVLLYGYFDNVAKGSGDDDGRDEGW
jgi:hypothetical protein